MKRKFALLIAGSAGALSLLIPLSSSAKVPAACVVVNGPHGLHLQLGYTPHSPSECKTFP